MSVLLIVPLLEGIATTLSATAVELGIYEGAAGIGSRAITGTVGATIGKKVDEAALNFLGPEKVQKINDLINKAYDYKKIAEDVFNKDIDSLRKRSGEERKKNIFTDPDPVPEVPKINMFSGPLPSSPIVKVGNIPSTIGSSAEVTPDPVDEHDPVQIGSNFPILKINESTISQFIIELSNEMTNTPDPVLAEQKVIKNNPSLAVVSTQLNGFYSSLIPKTKQFNEIAAVYNGQGLTVENNMKIFKNKENVIWFKITDETGKEVILLQNQGFVLPALYGVFLGPYSRNNSLAISKLDLLCSLHDHDYTTNGFFHQIGDEKLTSRILHSYDSFNDTEKRYAKIALTWFNSVGRLASTLIGSLPSDIDKQVSTDNPKDDIYSFIRPLETSVEQNQYFADRTKFYENITGHLQENIMSNSVFSPSNNPALSSYFNALEIEIL